MKTVALFFLLILPGTIFSQVESHKVSAAEKAMLPDYIRSIQSAPQSGTTTPPTTAVRASAEWEEIDALIITWVNYQSILKEIVRFAQTETQVFIVCSDSNVVINYLNAYSVPLTNIRYILAPYNSVWCRDYGPWNIYSNDVDSLALIDWIYNRPLRPNDDQVPTAIQNFTGLPMYQTTISPDDLVHTGGNFMTDGLGTGFSSNLIFDDNPTKTEAQIDTIMKNYMGINRYIKMTDLPYDQIHHIDMHLKLLDEETLLVGEYPPGVADGPQIEANLQYILANYNSPYGTPYKVIRIPMPPDAMGNYPDQAGDYRTYTNSVFVNRTLILPVYDQQYDTTAVRILHDALPGYSIKEINCNSIIPALGAIHCITKEVASNDPLLIVHQSLRDTYNTTSAYQVDARIQHRSGISNAQIYYRTDTTQPYLQSAMTLTNAPTNTWSGWIPQQSANTTVYYYIEAVSVSGKTQFRPLPAPASYWRFNVLLNIGFAELSKTRNLELGMIFPNPSKGITCIPVNSDKIQDIKITLLNLLGQPVNYIYSGITTGEKKYFIDTAELPAGVYLIEVSGNEERFRQKLIVR